MTLKFPQARIKLKRTGDRVIGRLDIVNPSIFTWHFGRDTAEKYLPKANMLEVWRIAKLPQAVSVAIGLVFGISGAEMRKSFDVTVGGEETIDGVAITRLELVPKNKDVRIRVAKAELWIPTGQAYSIRQKLTAPNGDYNVGLCEHEIERAAPCISIRFCSACGSEAASDQLELRLLRA